MSVYNVSMYQWELHTCCCIPVLVWRQFERTRCAQRASPTAVYCLLARCNRQLLLLLLPPRWFLFPLVGTVNTCIFRWKHSKTTTDRANTTAAILFVPLCFLSFKIIVVVDSFPQKKMAATVHAPRSSKPIVGATIDVQLTKQQRCSFPQWQNIQIGQYFT